MDLESAGAAPAARSEADGADLLARARAGEVPAFAGLYRRHHRRVHALCARMSGDRALADDLTQETFITAWRRLDSFRGESEFSTWLHRVAVNTVLAHKRRQAPWLRRIAGDVDELPEPGMHETPDHARDLEAAIARLPPRAREVFVLVDVEGWSHRETAAQLGIAEGTSKAQLSRARELLRGMLT